MSLLIAVRTAILLVEPVASNADLKLADTKAAIKSASDEVAKALDGVQVELTSPESSVYGALKALEAFSAFKSLPKAKSHLTETLSKLKEYVLVTEQAKQPVICFTRLQEIEQEIDQQLAAAARSFLKIGELLTESREEFERQTEFLEWAESKFNLKKASVFGMMQVYREFGSDSRFAGTPWTVLRQLIGAPEGVKAQAAELVADDKLSQRAAAALVTESTEPNTPVADIATVNVEEDTTPPFDYGTTLDLGSLPPKSQTPAATDDKDAYIKDLLEQISRLVANQDALFQQLREAKAAPKLSGLPMLPHFKSGCAHTRLGLEADATAKDVRAAYRAITAHYTPEANAEVFQLVTEARDALLSATA